MDFLYIQKKEKRKEKQQPGAAGETFRIQIDWGMLKYLVKEEEEEEGNLLG